jgi:hypothetical protein
MNSAGSMSEFGSAHVGYICVAGVSYPAQWWMTEGGELRDIRYLTQMGVSGDPRVAFPTGWNWGTCQIQRHTFRINAALVAGNNVINHNLNLSGAVLVDVRDAATGERIDVRVVSETANATTIAVIVAEPAVAITIVAVEA